MKKHYLLPNRFKVVGMVLSVVFGIAGFFLLQDKEAVADWMRSINWFDEIVVIGLSFSLLAAAFSRECDEDELTTEVRSGSLVMSIVINYLIVILATIFLYEFDYLNFLLVNLFTVLILYIIIFNIRMGHIRREAGNEK